MKPIFSFCFLLISFSASADFLIVRRIANLRESPSTTSEVLEKLNVGDSLFLVEDSQTDAYYHVTSLKSGQEGWVYRTLVQRMSGDLPTDMIPSGFIDDNGVVDIRILDVGAGQCNLIKLPNNKFVIYDAGGDATINGERTITQIKDYIPAGSVIELLVLSHTDADHIVAAEQVIRTYQVKKVLWTGYERSMITGNPSVAYNRLIDALDDHPQTENINLNAEDSTIAAGTSFQIGNAKFTFLCGFGKPESDWGLSNQAEKLNSVSIIMKLEYGNNSVLFCGDAVGRHVSDASENAPIATEKYIVDNAADYLRSTVVIAPHHGAKNGSSEAFVDLVQPEAVVFSAGHKHHHPTTRTANQYLRYVTKAKIYRTDRGDDEGDGEWTHTRITNCKDLHNDDTIQIQLRANHSYRVFYLDAGNVCGN